MLIYYQRPWIRPCWVLGNGIVWMTFCESYILSGVPPFPLSLYSFCLFSLPRWVGVGGGEDTSPYTSGGLSVDSSVCSGCAGNFRAKRTTHLFWFLGWWWLLDDLGC